MFVKGRPAANQLQHDHSYATPPEHGHDSYDGTV